MVREKPETDKQCLRPKPQTLQLIRHVPKSQVVNQDFWNKIEYLRYRYFLHRGNKRQIESLYELGLYTAVSCDGTFTIVNR